MALIQAPNESIWLQRLLKELRRQVENTRTIYKNNKGTIALSNNPEYYASTKHIDTQYHFVRECVENGISSWSIVLRRIWWGIVFTKALPKDRHWMLLAGRMGMKVDRC
jgi:hypothetical protein